jgi:hypothetical protein
MSKELTAYIPPVPTPSDPPARITAYLDAKVAADTPFNPFDDLLVHIMIERIAT